jgi:hypothetical protein
MKLADILILSLAVVSLIIGIHRVMVGGLGDAYWVLMLTMILFFLLVLRKKK